MCSCKSLSALAILQVQALKNDFEVGVGVAKADHWYWQCTINRNYKSEVHFPFIEIVFGNKCHENYPKG